MNLIRAVIRRILGSEPIPVAQSSSLRRVYVYVLHPVTGENANDFPPTISDEVKAEVAAIFRNGGRFYWHKPDIPREGLNEGYERVEHTNFEFVVRVSGKELVVVDRR